MRRNRLLAGHAALLAVACGTSPSFAAAPGMTLAAGSHHLAIKTDGLTHHVVLMDGRPLLDDAVDEFVQFQGVYDVAGRKMVLLAVSPGGNACASQYRAIDLAREPFIITPPFGNCSDRPAVSVVGKALHVDFPSERAAGLAGNVIPAASYSYSAGVLTTVGNATASTPAPAPRLRIVAPDRGPVHLYYRGPNTTGPTLLSPNVRQFLQGPPQPKDLPRSDVRGISVGMTRVEAAGIAAAIPMGEAPQAATGGASAWVAGWGPTPPPSFGMPSAAHMTCDPHAVDELALRRTMRTRTYASCLAVYPAPDDSAKVGRVSSLQNLDPASTASATMAAVIGKYGPPSLKLAFNEMVWFGKSADGRLVAIDALFTDVDAYENPVDRPEEAVTSPGPKLLDIEAMYFTLPEPPKPKPAAAPQL